jgi:hypothetical protein
MVASTTNISDLLSEKTNPARKKHNIIEKSDVLFLIFSISVGIDGLLRNPNENRKRFS